MKPILGIFIILLYMVGCNKQPIHGECMVVTIDSISQHQRYTTIPSDYWYYHTSIGVISTNTLNHNVGDKITVKLDKFTK